MIFEAEQFREKKVYVYGAGKIGEQCLAELREKGLTPVGVVVTSVMAGLKGVLAIEELEVGDRACFLIAGSVSNSVEIQKELHKRGFRDYIFYKDEIEARVRAAVSFVTGYSGEGLGIYGSGVIAQTLFDRVTVRGEIVRIGDEADRDFSPGSCSIEEAAGHGVHDILIADLSEGTSDSYEWIRKEATQKGIRVFDVFGRELSEEAFSDKKLEAEKRKSRCALVIDSSIPQYDKSAGGRLSYHYMKCLKNVGYSVWLLALNTGSNGYEKEYEEAGFQVIRDEDYPKTWLAINGRHFDVVFLQRPECSDFFLDTVLEYSRNAKLIYHPADLQYLRLLRQFEITGDPALKVRAEKDKETECRTIEKSDHIYVVGSREKEIVEELCPGKSVRDIPIYLYDEKCIPDRRPAEEKKDLIFVGGFAHAPNVDAVKWFYKEILPLIKQKIPDIVCHVVGSDAPKDIIGLADSNLVLEGFVSDERLKELYDQTRLSIAPLRFGAGIKGKIIEAAYYGLPVVTTTIGAEGIHEAERFVSIADSAETFADAIVELYVDPERIDRIAEDTRDVVRRNYTARVAEDILKEDLGI